MCDGSGWHTRRLETDPITVEIRIDMAETGMIARISHENTGHLEMGENPNAVCF
ncbi:MAG: hypothetical protein NTW32_06245 [Chloroflexi bacterium]|nr:hypothetical protein [Chloroflexota bacterium]